MVFITVAEYARQHGLSRQRVHYMVKQGRLPAQQILGQWMVEESAPWPEDKRVKTGAWRGWRKRKAVAGKEVTEEATE